MRARLIIVVIGVVLGVAAAGPWNAVMASPSCPNVLWQGLNNTDDASKPCVTVSGGLGNSATAQYASVGGGYTNSATSDFATVGGGDTNRAHGYSATVGGGYNNLANFNYSTIAGGSTNSTSANYSTVGGGERNSTRANYSTVGGGQNNSATAKYATIAGGHSNVAVADWTTVGGGWSNRASGQYATVAGGLGLIASGTIASVGGGSYNTASAQAATIAGGESNLATDSYATVGGGKGNRAGDNAGSPTDRPYATVGGGLSNIASREYATIGGGQLNTAGGIRSTVGGGYSNAASGAYSTVPGGYIATAGGNFSLAAGRQARALHAGSFVWSDSSPFFFASTAINQFSVRATGGARFVSKVDANGAPIAGVVLEAGGGAWNTLSDRNAKANITAVDSASILERVAALPVHLWNYRSQEASIRHIGPMAQDFSAAFGVGENDTTISTVDADGVALAAIQGLNQKLIEKDQEVAALQQRLAAVEQAQQPVVVTGVSVQLLMLAMAVTALGTLVLGGLAALVVMLLRRRTRAMLTS